MFFDFLYQSYPKEIANELMFLVAVAYNKHSETKNDEELESDLIEKAKKLSETEYQRLFSSERINFLNLKTIASTLLNSETEVKESFRSFLEFFFSTVILIQDEYFSNPFTEVSVKRSRAFQLEDDEQEENLGLPVKRTH